MNTNNGNLKREAERDEGTTRGWGEAVTRRITTTLPSAFCLLPPDN
ncbi:hypothetical protein I8752_17490 [Nostocaceae cyanobacterium CENA369]|uniref:Uncharacterized protein n=1 Tax=Dendronalium phyllosphericum CENA369 TaxID=1725256 RepID=A0A8J7LG47_9NOST|nr:hypothetical protein [Dendronalium phyllosphericum]MBH8574783.1 hypothetical protein [Dendronalium phyllosphericum CENA369]